LLKGFPQDPFFDFSIFLQQHFSGVHRQIYIDKDHCSYHNGIAGISGNIDETVAYLRKETEPYKNVVFIGVSSGGYAAILFGSLVPVQKVVAFIPQTICCSHTNTDETYRDIAPFINTTTQYYLYGDTSFSQEDNMNDIHHIHHISHCERIAHHPNVFVKKINGLLMKKIKNTGELYKILQHCINS
jgi:hypothetical protein